MSGEERHRAEAFAFPDDALSYEAAHALLRWALSEAAAMGGHHVQPEAWRFEAGPHGKPRLAAPAAPGDLRFNLSHCRSLVAVAIATGREVGIDVEPASRRVSAAMDLARRYFTPGEAAGLAAVADPIDRQHRFLRLWTAKEALVKATGHGLSLGLDQFEVDLEAGRYGPIACGPGCGPWRLSSLPHPAHFVSLACEGAEGAVDCRAVAWDSTASTFRETVPGATPARSLRSPP